MKTSPVAYGTLILALVVAVAVAIPSKPMAQGIAGPYLAARQAEQRGDVATATRYYAQALARDSLNVDLMERAMINQIATGLVDDGTAVARRYEQLRPGHHLGVIVLAVEGLQNGAFGTVHQLMEDDGPFVGGIIDAWALFAQGRVDEARGKLIALETSDANGLPGQIVSAYHVGLLEAAANNDPAAAAAFERAATMSNGGTLRLTRMLAGALARMDRPDDAVQVIVDRLAGTYGDASLMKLAADIGDGLKPEPLVTTAQQGAAEVLFGVSGLLARGRNRQIGLAYAQLATHLDPELIEAKLLIAQLFDQDEQYDLAIKAYQAIPNDVPQTLSARIGYAEVLQAAGRTEEAVVAMKAAIAQFPNAIEAHTALGTILRRESRFEEAAEAYDGAIALLPVIEAHNWGLLYQRGIALERSKQWDRAEKDFRKALELEPDQPDVLNYLGYSLVELGQKLEEAERMIEKAVEQRPEDGYIVDSLGWVLYRFGEFERAVEHLERAVELRPVDPVINDHFGDALWMVGRRTEARFQWKRALSFEPTEKDAIRIRRKLDEGLDKILAEEKAEGLPGIIGRKDETPNKDGG